MGYKAERSDHYEPSGTDSGTRDGLGRLFTDEDNDVRRTAGTTLATLASRFPFSAPRIAGLVAACSDPELDTLDKYEQRPGWDYAYDTLWSVAALADSPSAQD